MYINQQHPQQQQQRNDSTSNNNAVEEDDFDDEQKRTIFCGNISERCSEEILYELFLQAGPIESLKIVKDKDGRQRPFGFVTYCHQCSVGYCLKLLDGIRLFGKALILKPKNCNSNNNCNNNNTAPANTAIATANINNAVNSFLIPPAPVFQIDNDIRNRGDDRCNNFSSVDNNALRFGSTHNRNKKDDMNLTPRIHESNQIDLRPNPFNPFRNQLLSYLDPSFICNDNKNNNSRKDVRGGNDHHHHQSNSIGGGGNNNSSNSNPSKHASRNHNRPHKDNKPYNRPPAPESRKNTGKSAHQRKR